MALEADGENGVEAGKSRALARIRAGTVTYRLGVLMNFMTLYLFRVKRAVHGVTRPTGIPGMRAGFEPLTVATANKRKRLSMDGFEVIGLRLDLVVLAWIAGGFIAVAALLGAVAYVVNKKKSWGDPEFGWIVGASMTGGLGVIMWLVFVITLVPFQSLYHYWYGTTGTVESVTNIFEGGSGEISPGYVVELDSVDAPLLFDDPRILRASGEQINVSCSVAWVPSGVDRLNCWIAK